MRPSKMVDGSALSGDDGVRVGESPTASARSRPTSASKPERVGAPNRVRSDRLGDGQALLGVPAAGRVAIREAGG